jgi:hypothetical protein
MSLEASWERQSYEPSGSSASTALTREERRRVGLHLDDWATSWLRWDAGVALDHLREYADLETLSFAPHDYVAAETAIDLRLAADRVALVGSLGWWAPLAGGDRFATGDLRAAWRSTTDTTRPLWSVMTETSLANNTAPLALWSGAGTGQARQGLLRAHPLLSDDVLTGPAFGRRIANASLEYARPVVHTFAGGLSLAGFVDGARAWRRANGLDTSPLFIDAGVGLRVHAPGSGGIIRVDLAHGLRGGGTTLSATWVDGWPR